MSNIVDINSNKAPEHVPEGMFSNNAALAVSIGTNKLKRKQVASAMCISIHTLDAWLRPPTNANYRPMSDSYFKLFSMILDLRPSEFHDD